MVVTGNNSDILTTLLQQLNKEFRMKDKRRIHYFLGIQVKSLEKGLFLCQQKYVEDLLAVAAMSDCSPMPIPLLLQLNKVQLRSRCAILKPYIFKKFSRKASIPGVDKA